MIMRKVLSCLVIIAILVSAVPVSVFAVNDSNNSKGNASNRSNENLLEKSFTENNSAEVIMPFLANNTIGMQHLAFNKTVNNSNALNTTVEPVTLKDKEESKNNSVNVTSNYQNKTVPSLDISNLQHQCFNNTINDSDTLDKHTIIKHEQESYKEGTISKGNIPTIPVPGSVKGSVENTREWVGYIEVPPQLERLKIEIDWTETPAGFWSTVIDPMGHKYGLPYDQTAYSGGLGYPQYFIFENPMPGTWKISLILFTGTIAPESRDFTITIKTDESIQMVKRKVFMSNSPARGLIPSYVEISVPNGLTFNPGDIKVVKVSIGSCGKAPKPKPYPECSFPFPWNLNNIVESGMVTISTSKDDNVEIITDQVTTAVWEGTEYDSKSYEEVREWIEGAGGILDWLYGKFMSYIGGGIAEIVFDILDLSNWIQGTDLCFGESPTGPEWTNEDKYEIHSFAYDLGDNPVTNPFSSCPLSRIDILVPIKLNKDGNIPLHIYTAYEWWDGGVFFGKGGHEETITFKTIPEFTPLDLCMVLDRSGSMSESMGSKTKIQGVKEAATGVVNVLFPQDRVSIVSFSDTATTDVDFTSDFSAVKTKINQLSAGGGTSFGAGLKLALDQFNAHGNPDHIPAILFMSDGKHWKSPDPDTYVAECKNKKIPIFTVGFAKTESEVDVTWLKKMSSETDGEYHFVGEIFDLQNIFLKMQHKASGWESIATYVGAVNEGETITAGTFYVDPTIDDLRVTLNWPGSNLDLKLFDPNGRQIDFSAPNVIYSGDTKPEYVIIKDPQSGAWTAKVYGKSIGSSEKYYVLVTKYEPPKPPICKVQITSDPSLQDRPSTVYANGYYYVAYQSWETSYSGLEHGRDIFIEMFASDWTPIARAQVTSNRAYKDSPSLVFANNKLYVAYVSNEKGATANDYDVIVKEYDPSSLACLRSEKYLTTLQSRQDLPALYYKDGYFYLAYRSWERGSSYNGDIYIKKFDSNWNQLKKVQVTSKGSLQARPSLAYANGYIYVAYYSMETGDRDIFVKRLNSNLNLDGFKKQITSEASEQSFPSISFVNNQFTIVYGSTETGTLGIFMKKYDSNWNFIKKTKVVDDNSAHERRPSMTYAQNNYWVAYVHNLIGSDDWNIFAITPGCEDGSSPTPTPTPTPKLRWEITVDKAEYSPGDYVHLTQQFINEGEETVLITNLVTTTFIASDGSIVLEEDLSSSISVTLGAGGQWSFGTSFKLPADAPEGYYDVRVSISGGRYIKTVEDLFFVKA